MNDKNMHSITDEKEVKLFISKLEAVNQIMKKTDKTGTYNILNPSFDTYYRGRCIPRTISISNIWYNKVQQAIIDEWSYNDFIMSFYPVSVNSDNLFIFLRDNKKIITSIEFIKEDEFIKYITILTKNNNIKFIMNHVPFIEEDNLNRVSCIAEFGIKHSTCNIKDLEDEDLFNDCDDLKDFLSIKGVFMLHLDLDEEVIYLDDNKIDEHSNLSMIISHKYMTGFSGCKEDNTTLYFKVNEIENYDNIEDVYRAMPNTYELEMIINRNNKMTVNETFVILDI